MTTDQAHSLAQILNVLAGALQLAFASWCFRFARRIRPDQLATSESRAELLHRARKASMRVGILNLGILVTMIIGGVSAGISLIAFAFGMYIALALIQGIVLFSLERSIRGLQLRHLDHLLGSARLFAATFAMYLSYFAVVIGLSTAVPALMTALELPPDLITGISVILVPAGVLAGVLVNAWLSPVFVRLMFRTSRLQDPALRAEIEECFRSAGLSVSSVFILEFERNKSHNAMISGLRRGTGPLGPSLFLTRSLITELTRDELRAVLLHEVSHLSLNHLRKRALAGFAGFVLTMVPYVVLMAIASLLLPQETLTGISVLGIMACIYFQLPIVTRVARRHELEADENAIRLGGGIDALEGALRKLTALNDASTRHKDPSRRGDPSAAHPEVEERVAILRERAARGFPPQPGLRERILADVRHHLRWAAPATAALAVALTVVWLQVLKPATDLRLAAANGDLERVKALVESGVEPDTRDRTVGTYPLIAAASFDQVEVARYLLDRGANPNEAGYRGWTALMAAAMNGHEKTARLLVESGASVNYSSPHRSTALTIAAEMGHAEVVRLLLEKGANPDAKDNDGDTSLGMALARGHSGVVELLRARGARDRGRYEPEANRSLGSTRKTRAPRGE